MKVDIQKILYDSNNTYYPRRATELFFKKNYYTLYKKIINFNIENDFKENLYLILNDLKDKPVCVICGNNVSFRKISQGYSKYCSVGCVGKDKNVKNKREKTNLKNIGVKYTLQSKEKKDQIKRTNLKKYGVEISQQSDIVKEKAKQTNLDKYGVEHHFKLESQKAKQRKTILDKYGVENPQQNKEIKDKTKETNLKKYNVEYPSQSKEIKDKIKQTNLDKYGVEHNFQNENVKDKIKQTLLEKYNVNHYSKSIDFIKKVKQTKKIRYNNENFNNREKSKKTSLEKYGVEYPSQLDTVKNKIKKSNIENFKKGYSTLLKINENDIVVNNDFVIIKNFCTKHKSFEISKSLLYSRTIDQSIKNICTKCNPINKHSSIKEKEVVEFIKSLHIKYEFKNYEILNNQELDIYLPDHNLAIEFNGLYWHSEFFKEKNYHLNKTIKCKKKGIQLLHIFEDEWIFKSDIVKSMIKSKLGLINNKIYARKCFIKEISIKESKEFLNKNHIQGYVNSKIKLGLFYNNELVCVMSFNKINNNTNKYLLNRFCNKLNTNIIGGASKLFKFFENIYIPKEITTFADNRYSNGDLYNKLGFMKTNNIKPDYSYFNKNKKIRYHKFNFRKYKLIKEGFNKFKTEHEIMLEKGYLRIYDSGKLKFKKTYE